MLNDADYLRLAAGQTYRDALAQVTGHADMPPMRPRMFLAG
jgi:hypothetical protein